MNIYISHCGGNYDYENELYQPIRESELSKMHHFFLPHEPQNIDVDVDVDVDVDAVAELKHTDILVAEASYPSTGQGIELAQAKAANVPIICFYRTGARTSSSLRFVTNRVVEYTDVSDLFTKLQPS